MSKRRASSATDGPTKKSKSLASQFASLVDPTPRAREGEEDDNAEFTRPEDIDYGYGTDEDDRMETSGRLRMQSGIEELDEKYQGRVARSPEASDDEYSDDELESEGDELVSDGADDEEDDSDVSGRDDDDDDDGFSGGEDEEDEEDTAAQKFERELAQLQQEEQEVLEGISKVKDEEVDQAVAVREQKLLWTQLLEFRIAVQGSLACASRMPKPDVFAAFEEGQDPQVEHRLQQLQKLALATVNDLRTASANLLQAEPTLARVAAIKDPEPATEVDELWEALEQEHDAVKPWRAAEVTRWGRKTMAAKQLQAGKLQSLSKSAMEQVAEVLTDMPRLLKRTQLKRGEYKIIGEAPAAAALGQEGGERDTHLQQHDEEVFDDTDFYERLLQELIETGSQASLQAALSGKTAVKKAKAKVDTRASKGRKIRYQVHPKLVNFMYATGFEMPPVAEELFSRLFGQSSA